MVTSWRAQADKLFSTATDAAMRPDWSAAVGAAAAALRLYTQGGHCVGQAECHRLLGELALWREEWNEARSHLLEGLCLFSSASVVSGAARCLLLLAQLDEVRGLSLEAEQEARLALGIYEERRDVAGQARAHLMLAQIHREAARPSAAHKQKSRAEALTALRLLGRRPNRRTFGRCGFVRRHWRRLHLVLRGQGLLELGRAAYWEDDRDEARAHLEEALVLFSRADDPPDIGKCHLELGRLLLHQEPEAAEQHLRQALGLFEAEEAILDQAHCLAELGELASMRGRGQEAEGFIGRAMQLYERAGSSLGRARCLHQLGWLAVVAGCYDMAQGHFEEAQQLFADLNDLVAEGNCRLELGKLAAARHERDEARRQWEIALSLYTDAGEALGRANCLVAMARLLLDQGVERLPEARDLLQEALSPYEQRGDDLGRANCLQTLGVLEFFTGNVEGATRAVNAARGLYEKLEEPGGRADCTLLLGQFAAREGRHSAAGSLFDDALVAYRSVGDPHRSSAAALLSGIARLRQGQPGAAVELILEAVHEAESLRGSQASRRESVWWLAELQHVYTMALEVLSMVGNGVAGLSVIEAARGELIAGLMHAGGSAETDPEVNRLLDTVRALQAELDSLAEGNTLPEAPPLAMGVAKRLSLRAERRQRLEDDLNTALGDLERRVGEFIHRLVPAPLASGEALDLVPDGTWLLAYHLDDGRVLTRVWVDPEGEAGIDRQVVPEGRVRRLLGTLAGLDAQNRLGLGIIERPASQPPWAGFLPELAHCLLPLPIRARLRLSAHALYQPARFLIVPSGSLWAVPWGALPIAGKPLCEYAAVTLAPSLRSLPHAVGVDDDGFLALIDPAPGSFRGEREFFSGLYERAEFCGDPG
ncbi:MAG: tetratricopeptide repeat protein, partial [Thermoleophilia bacterium]|nr:tetratricopeptide repeat protein [Thermoleophilia bacterium]